MRIGLSSIVGDGFGFGSFVFGEVPSGGSFPPYGTVINTYNAEYPIAQGGYWFYSPVDGTTQILSQRATVDEVADGAGGFFLSNWRDVAYKENGDIFYVSSSFEDYTGGYTITIDGNSYYTQRANSDYRHDGAGSYISGLSNIGYYPYGGEITTTTYQTEVPSGSGNYFNNGLIIRYRHNGTGGYYVQFVSDYYTYGEYITNDGTYSYYWDGYGGYYT